MAIGNVNSIIRAYLATCGTLTALIGGATPRIYCPRLPENADLPAISFFARGGVSTPYIPGIVTPSVQIDCWSDNSIGARLLYRTVYTSLQGIQNQAVGAYTILSAIEEVQGMDLVDDLVPNFFRVLTYFSIMICAE